MTRLGVFSCVLLMGLASTAQAKEFRVLKGQQRDIARFQRAVERSALHPKVKQKVLRTIAKAEKAVIQSKADYKRVHTRVTRYGGTLVFSPAWGRNVTLHMGSSGNSRARSIEIFNYGKKSRSAFRARELSPQLTLMYRGRLSDTKETSAFRLYTQNRQKSAGLTTKLGQTLLWSGTNTDRQRSLISQLEPMLTGSAPKGLTVGRSDRVKALDKAPPVAVELNPR